MLRLVAARLGLGIVSLLLVSLAIFAITSLLPGDAAEELLGQYATRETVAGLRAQLGLDLPGHVRYLHWLGGLITGDFGRSLANGVPVAQLIGSRLPNSLMLAAATAAVSVPLALTIGITAAMWRGGAYDRAVSMLTLSVVSVPEFLVATAAVIVFAVHLRWLSALSAATDITSVAQFFRVFALPVFSLCCVIIAQMVRMTRAAIIDQLRAPYVEMAVLKGVGPFRVVLRHALPNAIGPIANAVALSLSYLLGGVIIVETIFNYPGIAKLMVDGVATRDLPVVQACAMIFCAAYLVLVTTADVVAILANPRLRHR
ncbi:ABC transporter permease [Neoroseomonas oryzicola]|uniref:ABC transporter permease n=1 Tax=Neoroseomonas oryzicola TaxID=535904 RepID=A0A9X9WBD4_9PROT|nr:ABC transporter permease [Neoroseomonas oryzicola]MBR0657644.1 ABC transporter permease [Neoroseomonas oryzicola]NKE18900.1 ABC transporter permease [Neoroseomonas oryzicola]